MVSADGCNHYRENYIVSGTVIYYTSSTGTSTTSSATSPCHSCTRNNTIDCPKCQDLSTNVYADNYELPPDEPAPIVRFPGPVRETKWKNQSSAAHRPCISRFNPSRGFFHRQ